MVPSPGNTSPTVTVARYIRPDGQPGAWIAQYPFNEPGKDGPAIEIAPDRRTLLDLIDAVAASEGWTDYQIHLHVDARWPR